MSILDRPDSECGPPLGIYGMAVIQRIWYDIGTEWTDVIQRDKARGLTMVGSTALHLHPALIQH